MSRQSITATPAKGKEAPANVKETPAKGKEAPAKAKETPAKGKEAPAKAKETPAKCAGLFSGQHFSIADDVPAPLHSLLLNYMRDEGATKSSSDNTKKRAMVCFAYKTLEGFAPECVFVLPAWIHDRDTTIFNNSVYCIKQNAEDTRQLQEEIEQLKAKIKAIKDIVQ